jgi:flavin reductase (DIM6/NTAB) family NADH-FMN oxidoreductase RutF
MDFKNLRENFGLFATGVAIAATQSDDESNIITINSLSSISLDPALLLFCIDNKSSNFKAFTSNKNFSINLLTQDQIDLSKHFSKTQREDLDVSKFFSNSELGNLVLKDSMGYFECEKHDVIESGDHNIIIGKIVNFAKLSEDKKPLIYFKGAYNSL